MTNSAIADNFSLLSKLMDIHGENSFKSKSYSIAAFTIENLPQELSSVDRNKIAAIKGIGDSVANKIVEQLDTESLSILDEYISKTPPGIIEMLQNIKGLGPKKIATVWKEMEIETVGELLYACNENRLTLFKGFGEKTQLSIKNSIEFYFSTFGNYLYAQIETYAMSFDKMLQAQFKNEQFVMVGDFKRQLNIIDKIEWVTTSTKKTLVDFFVTNHYKIQTEDEMHISFKGAENVLLQFYLTNKTKLAYQQFLKNGSKEFLSYWQNNLILDINKNYQNEEEIFAINQVDFIPIYKRETINTIELAKNNLLPKSINTNDIKGIIHCHSRWSDGSNSLAEMAYAAKEKGLEYLVISDHSKTAFYAQGLQVERVIAQQQEIEELNKKLAPFKIFKSIESDILNDGSLDYENEILQTFDIVIASVHSNLSMPEDKAMMRLINAIENPYTSILGHLTGRLLLSRNGYPIDHEKIIDACAYNNVVIELNAHPRRLDIDWKWIDKALDKGVLISINPDAHNIEGFDDCKYGVLVAQKTLLTPEKNLSSFSLEQFENFIVQQHLKRNSH
ncbi:MAG: DNA polymerase/3'-5' exonuclease PolX [Chitinophagaceae bacterium]|nr:DNA polymerase/3'-5' exonuclease PolX [Chitinophagaceae bacterium]